MLFDIIRYYINITYFYFLPFRPVNCYIALSMKSFRSATFTYCMYFMMTGLKPGCRWKVQSLVSFYSAP